jgi:hypothetical protein
MTDDYHPSVEAVPNPVGPGNALLLEIEIEHVTEDFTSFGERGRAVEDKSSRQLRPGLRPPCSNRPN